jgi:hypothetical protein
MGADGVVEHHHGTVSDASGAALPGATVTISSPALQVGQMSKVSEPDGTYRFGDLPVGTYKVAFELQGFKGFVREDVRLPVGFVARIDAALAIGGIEETITVSGQSPVVDQSSTTTSVNISLDTLESVPGRPRLSVFVRDDAGVTTAGGPDVGDSALASRSNIQATAAVEIPRSRLRGSTSAPAKAPPCISRTSRSKKCRSKRRATMPKSRRPASRWCRC